MRVEPLCITSAHLRPPIRPDLDGVGFGPDEVPSTDDLLSVHEHFVPSLAVLAADAILVDETEGVCSGGDTLLHRLGLVGSDILTACQLGGSVAGEGYGGFPAVLVDLELDLDIGASATAGDGSIVVVIIVVVGRLTRGTNSKGVHTLAPVSTTI